jgi:hypothetical protein
MLRAAVAFMAVLLPAEAALAEPAFYFHKPGVDRASFDSEFGTCVELAGGASPGRQQVYSPNPYAAAIGGFFGGVMASRERRAMVLSIMRVCMADKGYQRIVAPKEVLREVDKLEDEARTSRLFDLATATAPQGEVLPR